MQLKREIKRGSFTAAILLTGCLMLTTAGSVMAEGAKVQLDFAKIRQALNKGGADSGGAAAPAPGVSAGQMPVPTAAPAAKTANGMQGNSVVIGTTDQEMNQMMGDTMRDAFVGSDIMAEMQKKVMAENMGSIQEAIQASVLQSMRGSMQQPAKDSPAK